MQAFCGQLRSRTRAVALVLVLVLVVVGCSSGGGRRPDPAGRTTTTDAVSVVPRAGECRGPITAPILVARIDTRPLVPCEGPHGSETVLVTSVPAAVASLPYDKVEALSEFSPELRPALDQCSEAYARHVGESRIGPDAVRPVNLRAAYFLPPAEAWAQGARWVRCDAFLTPLEDQAARSTTEDLRGLANRDPLPLAFRTCFRDEQRKYQSSSCEQPHENEVMLVLQLSDPQVDALASKLAALREHLDSVVLETCRDRVADRVGLASSALRDRGDIAVELRFGDLNRWAVDPQARAVSCVAATQGAIRGTLEGLGTRPLPRP